MSFDNLCKLLSEKYPERFATWILGTPPTSLKVLKTELSIEPIRADSVILLQTAERILHLEFQVKLESEPPLPLRMLDYWVRLYRLYRIPITQVVVLLIPPTEMTPIETVFSLESTRHEYRVVKLWEEDPTIFLNDLALLPLATLAAATVPEQLLRRVAERVSQIESEQQRQEVSAYVQLLAGLKFKKPLIRQIFREGVMRESVIYQEIYQEGEAKGEVKGRAEGERSLVLRLLTRRVGEVPAQLRSQIEVLPLEQLEALGEALLDFRAIADLETWLQTHSES
ncbi:MAG: Rpn family recombination-promoting nuclease/putative transposase [Leptolyngbyaceae bacterium]|nr:Rpn family recombination-promoting nuclease/putative transposase [Leptolyngbyaceae bacterium]